MSESNTFHLGLIGWPVEHSLSPAIHQAALETCGLTGSYRLFPVPPLPEGRPRLDELFTELRHRAITGVNVTIPHKQNVIPWLDELTPAAQTIGAVNTIFNRDQKLIGDNTDADGFLTDLKSRIPSENQAQSAVILGAGGASRAVSYALAQDGWQVIVAARDKQQAQALVADLKHEARFSLQALPLEFSRLRGLHPDLIVNATPLGMTPNSRDSIWPEVEPFPEDCFVYDLVYNPAETRLVRQARRAGLQAANGLGMLTEQAVLAFERWTDCPAPRLAMQTAAAEALQESRPGSEV